MRRIRLLPPFVATLVVVLAAAGLAQAATTDATADAAGAAQGGSTAASPSSTFGSFGSFQAATQEATYADYASRSRTGGVQNEQAFAQMQSYLENLYRGVQTVRSFAEQGNTFDCVTTMSQPTVRALDITHLASGPVASSPGAGLAADGQAPATTSPPELGLTNGVGAGTSCPGGTIPMQRVTLDAMTRFPNLQAFLSKGVGSQVVVPGYNKGHLHAYGYQNVANAGDNTTLNLWNPAGDFSLSQEWIVGGSGSGTQTVEGGWVHDPSMFGSNSVLFIFSTPNDYSSGCWNLDCTGFVQVNNAWTLGAGWSHYSSYGGTQYIFTMQWKYYEGNWWLLLNPGGGSWTDVGYYPGSLYAAGPLAGGDASLTEFGGEVCNGPSGGDDCTNPNWPQMGSGKFASAGWQQAAYQNDLFYINSGGAGFSSSLTPVTESSKCYSINFTPSSSGGSWGSYIYFGGPGGYMC